MFGLSWLARQQSSSSNRHAVSSCGCSSGFSHKGFSGGAYIGLDAHAQYCKPSQLLHNHAKSLFTKRGVRARGRGVRQPDHCHLGWFALSLRLLCSVSIHVREVSDLPKVTNREHPVWHLGSSPGQPAPQREDHPGQQAKHHNWRSRPQGRGQSLEWLTKIGFFLTAWGNHWKVWSSGIHIIWLVFWEGHYSRSRKMKGRIEIRLVVLRAWSPEQQHPLHLGAC